MLTRRLRFPMQIRSDFVLKYCYCLLTWSQAYAAGYLEANLTQHHIYQYVNNFVMNEFGGPAPAKLMDWLIQNLACVCIYSPLCFFLSVLFCILVGFEAWFRSMHEIRIGARSVLLCRSLTVLWRATPLWHRLQRYFIICLLCSYCVCCLASLARVFLTLSCIRLFVYLTLFVFSPFCVCVCVCVGALRGTVVPYQRRR